MKQGDAVFYIPNDGWYLSSNNLSGLFQEEKNYTVFQNVKTYEELNIDFYKRGNL